MVKRLSILSVFLLFLMCSLSKMSGKYEIFGTIISKDTQKPLGGVNVAVEGTEFKTVTNLSGEYELTALPTQDYTVCFSLAGYDTLRVDVLEMESGEKYRIDVALQPRG